MITLSPIWEVQDHFLGDGRVIHKGLTDNGGIMKSVMKVKHVGGLRDFGVLWYYRIWY